MKIPTRKAELVLFSLCKLRIAFFEERQEDRKAVKYWIHSDTNTNIQLGSLTP